MTQGERRCPRCGYVFQPWETECARCAWQARQACQVCGRVGIIGECARCHKDLCESCARREQGELRCPGCTEQTAEPPAGAALPYPVRPSVGWWDSVVRALAFLRASTALMWSDRDLLLPSLFSLGASAALVGAAGLAIWQAGLWQELTEDNHQVSWPLVLVLLALALALYVVSYFFTGMTVHLVDVALRGRDARLGKAFADAVRNFPALLWLAMASLVVSAFTAALRRRSRSALGDLAADAVDRAWSVAAFLVLPIIILEDAPLRRAAERARALHTRQLIPIAVGEVAVGLVTGVISTLAALACVGGSAAAFWYLGPVAGAAVAAMTTMALALVMSYTHYLRTAYYTCLYLWAVAREEAAELAPVPAPLAAALGA